MRRRERTVATRATIARAACALLALLGAAASAQATSVYVQDTTTAANGGTGKAARAADRLQDALADAYPCAETSDNGDLADAVADETARSDWEGGDPGPRLQQLGRMVGADILVGIQALPAPGGGTMVSAFAMNARTGATMARAMGSEEEVARSLTQQLAGQFSNACKPHWVGSLTFSGQVSQSTKKEDAGPMLAAVRQVKRTKTETFSANSTMSAQLLPASAGAGSVDQPMARVVHMVEQIHQVQQKTSGETQCRVHGKNPYWEGFSESYTEIGTVKGRATGMAPIHIMVFSDGRYMIQVTVPGGETYASFSTEKAPSTACESKAQPVHDAISAPPGTFAPSGFDAEGRVDPKHKDRLVGESTSPDGKSRTSWNLRLVKPAGP